MKKIFLALITVLACSVSFAQSGKMRNPKNFPPQPLPPQQTHFSNFAENEITGHLGFVAGAVNIGATYTKLTGQTGFGGYVHAQTEKASAGVSSLTTFGGHYKINLIPSADANAYISPGFGVAMMKAFGESKTVFGPSLKIGGQIKLTRDFALGIERFVATNWFDEKVTSLGEITTLAASFTF